MQEHPEPLRSERKYEDAVKLNLNVGKTRRLKSCFVTRMQCKRVWGEGALNNCILNPIFDTQTSAQPGRPG